MVGIAETMRREMVRYLVGRAITCPATGEVLDVRTCVVLVDVDGDPCAVLSPAGWEQLPADARERLAAQGITREAEAVAR